MVLGSCWGAGYKDKLTCEANGTAYNDYPPNIPVSHSKCNIWVVSQNSVYFFGGSP